MVHHAAIRLSAVLMLLTGCAHLPEAARVKLTAKERLQEHVRFLASPELDGRKPLSVGSQRARHYIAQRFAACGLVPWGNAGQYEQRLVLGTNVIGVLPGTDKALADEIVLVSAHYDHVGGSKPGAADNASGVAVLLEIAERMAHGGTPPKRSVCFAAFDSEESMLWGSVAFTCREDFDPKKIAAVVNVDTLGRKAFDVLDDTLFLAHSHPSQLTQIASSASDEHMRVVPCGTSVIAPSGDHFPFLILGIPVFLFSNGTFDDYHTRKDTFQRLDYDLLDRSTSTIFDVVAKATTADELVTPGSSNAANPPLITEEDVVALRTILDACVASRAQMNLSPDTVSRFESTLREIERSHAECVSAPEEDNALVRSCLGSVLALLSRYEKVEPVNTRKKPYPVEPPPDDKTAGYDTPANADRALQFLFFTTHRASIGAMYRDCAKRLLQRSRFALFVEGPTGLDIKRYDLLDEEVKLTNLPDGRQRLSVALPCISVRSVSRKTIPLNGASVAFMWEFFSCEGTPDELLDYCLLQWRRNQTDDTYASIWTKVLSTVFPEAGVGDPSDLSDPLEVLNALFPEPGTGEMYQKWLQWRRERKAFSSDEEWLAECMKSRNLQLMRSAMDSLGSQIIFSDKSPNLMRSIFMDRSIPGDLRAQAIALCARANGDTKARCFIVDSATVRDLITLLGDDTVVRQPEKPIDSIAKDFPLVGLAMANHIRPRPMKGKPEGEKPNTFVLSDHVLFQLRTISEQDFGKDTALWSKWLDDKEAAMGGSNPVSFSRQRIVAILPFPENAVLLRMIEREQVWKNALEVHSTLNAAILWMCDWTLP